MLCATQQQSVDGMLGKEAQTLLQRLAEAYSTKTSRPYSQIMFFFKTRVSIALIKAAHLCIRGSRKRFESTRRFTAPDSTDPCAEFLMMFP